MAPLIFRMKIAPELYRADLECDSEPVEATLPNREPPILHRVYVGTANAGAFPQLLLGESSSFAQLP